VASDPSNLLQKIARPIRKLSGGEFPATKVAEIREGRFGSRHFWNLEKMRSDRGRVEPHFCIADDSVYKFYIVADRRADGPGSTALAAVGVQASAARWSPGRPGDTVGSMDGDDAPAKCIHFQWIGGLRDRR